MMTHTHLQPTHFRDQESVSSALSVLMSLAIVSALAFWLVLLPY